MTETCARCEQVHPACGAHNRQGGPCGRKPLVGQRVCQFHGGRSPQAMAAASRRLEREAVMAELASMGVAVDVDPEEALLAMVREAMGNVVFLRAKVQELEQRAATSAYGDGNTLAGPTGNEKKPNEAAPHVFVAMYAEWCDRLAQYSSLALRAGVEERRVRLAEREAEALMGAVVTALDATGLMPEQQEAFRVALAEQLRRMDGDESPLSLAAG